VHAEQHGAWVAVVTRGLLGTAVASSDSRCGGLEVRKCGSYDAGSCGGGGGRKKTKAGEGQRPSGQPYLQGPLHECLLQQICLNGSSPLISRDDLTEFHTNGYIRNR
jgi:hypothetical protein